MDPKIEQLILSYLEETISFENEKLLIEWFKNNPDSVKEFNDFRKIWGLTEITTQFDKDFLEKEWKFLLQKVYRSKLKEKNKQNLFWNWIPRLAAVFILGAVISAAIAYQIFNPNTIALTYYEVNTPAGSKSEVTLPDGTTIWLNAKSNLKYSNEYGRKDRKVFLTGEAYFDVKANPKKQFQVHTSDLNIKAYGTTFNVKSYPEENTVETTLIEGSIGVTRTKFKNKHEDEVMLEPNQRVVYYKPTNGIKADASSDEINSMEQEKSEIESQKLTYLISKGIEPQEFTSWKEGTLFINSETLQELAIKLERKYDMKIHFEDESLKSLKFTGSLENETIEQIIEAIGIAANINYRIDDRDVWLKDKTN